MNSVLTTVALLFLIVLDSQSQDVTMAKEEMIVTTDTTKSCCGDGGKNVVAVGGKYYFNSLEKTRSTLSSNGFVLDQEALEIQLRLYNLPKFFYFHQLGTLTNTNYVSVTGFGLKEDIRIPIIKNSSFILTPYVEIGGGLFRMNIVKGVKSNSITSVLGSQTESHSLDNFVLTGDVGLDLGAKFKIGDRDVSIIANGGYLVNYPTEWRIAGSLAFKEKINFTTPYVGATIKIGMCCTANGVCCK